jgi:YD repeat-containing protein
MKNRLVLFIVTICLSQIVTAQNSLPSTDYTPQKPTTAAFTKYGEIPIDYSTGVPNIQIPICELKSGNITIPVSISYHASGIKVRDVASELGLGWVLNAGGFISQTTVGRIDGYGDHPAIPNARGIFNYINSLPNLTSIYNAEYNYWHYVTKQINSDNYSDRFYFSLPSGESGIFRKDFYSDTIYTIPYKPIKIIKNPVTTGTEWDYKIITSDGTQHFFVSSKIVGEDDIYIPKKIISWNNSDTVLFYLKTISSGASSTLNYSDCINWSTDYPQLIQGNGCAKTIIDPFNTTQNFVHNASSNRVYGAFTVLDSIVSRNETAHFQYLADRQDRGGQGLRLQSINLKFRNSNKRIFSYRFKQSYFGAGNPSLRLKLDSLYAQDSNGKIIEKYSFKYNSTNLPNYPDLGTSRGSFYEDYWGYYNGKEKTYCIPSFLNDLCYVSMSNYYGDMHPDEDYAKASILSEIQFPTGGKDVFDFELNRASSNPYNYTSHNEYPFMGMGGLRIKTITSYSDNNTISLIKSYEYENAQNKTISAENFYYAQESFVGYVDPDNCPETQRASYTQNTFNSNPIKPITMYNGASVLYEKVTEYLGTSSANIGKTVYTYNISDFEEGVDPELTTNDYHFYNYYQWDHGNYSPLLNEKYIYKYVNGGYSLLQKESNSYEDYKQKTFYTGINLGSVMGIENWGNCSIDGAFNAYLSTNYYFQSLAYSDTKGYTNVPLLSSKQTINYFDDYQVIFNDIFTYDDHTHLIKKETSTSKDDWSIIKFKYPYNFKGTAVYDTLVAHNCITPIIEKIDSLSGKFLQSIKTNYKDWGNKIYAPETIISKKGSKNVDTRIQYYNYDTKGNVLDVSKAKDIRDIYIWGYHQTYPIAKFDNTTYSTITSNTTLVNYVKQLESYTDLSSQTTRDNLKSLNDNIRKSLPSNVLVTTFTFNPLLGMTSQTDPNGVTTYYEYDSFGRLKLIRDDDGNILKTYEYNYKQ